MKTLKKLGKSLTKAEQQKIHGGGRKKKCLFGDSICCGDAAWQCGNGVDCGGFYNAANGTCSCV